MRRVFLVNPYTSELTDQLTALMLLGNRAGTGYEARHASRGLNTDHGSFRTEDSAGEVWRSPTYKADNRRRLAVVPSVPKTTRADEQTFNLTETDDGRRQA